MKHQVSIKISAIILTVLSVIGMILSVSLVFVRIADRDGTEPYEPILDLIPAYDVSLPLFGILYIASVSAMVWLIRDRVRLLRGIQAFVILQLLRVICILIVPLSPPIDLVPLQDPFAQLFYPSTAPFSKDLFFSGHTATAVLLCFAVPNGKGRWLFILAALFIAMAVLVQHVHWTADVIAAPFAALFAWQASAYTQKWSLKDHIR